MIFFKQRCGRSKTLDRFICRLEICFRENGPCLGYLATEINGAATLLTLLHHLVEAVGSFACEYWYCCYFQCHNSVPFYCLLCYSAAKIRISEENAKELSLFLSFGGYSWPSNVMSRHILLMVLGWTLRNEAMSCRSRCSTMLRILLASMMRAFRALGVQVALEMKGIGKVAL